MPCVLQSDQRTKHMTNTNDMNRDPISGTPGSHPVGVGVGGAGGAVAGAIVGSMFGPIGTLIGGGLGTLAGAAAGKDVAERVDPTGESEYWRTEYASRPYYDRQYEYKDYEPAYRYGNELRASGSSEWDASTESRAREGWDRAKTESRLQWDKAKDAIRDAFDRSDRTYRTYQSVDSAYANSYRDKDYYQSEHDYERDYRPAYHYGAHSRSNSAPRDWDDSVDAELGQGWTRARGNSRLEWSEARHAARESWQDAGRHAPGYAEKQP